MPNTSHGLPYPASTAPPNVPADMAALANALDAYIPLVVWKTATQTIANATVVDDTHLFLTLNPGTYHVRALLRVLGPTGADFQWQWSFSGTLTKSSRQYLAPDVNATTLSGTGMRPVAASYTTLANGGTITGVAAFFLDELTLVVSVAGQLRLRWAQMVTDAAGTSLNTENRLTVQKLYG